MEIFGSTVLAFALVLGLSCAAKPLSIVSVAPGYNLSSTSLRQDNWILFSRNGKTVIHSREFSEEDSGYSGRQTAPIAGLSCSKRFCDNKQLVVVRDGPSAPVQDSGYWTEWISEEGPSQANCPRDMIVNEMQCEGRYCDNLRLQCGRLSADYRVDASDIRTVDWFSEEQGERLCPDGHYISGIACQGRFCDEIKLFCARIYYKSTTTAPSKNFVSDSARFAPVYFFDGKGPENCLPDWPSDTNDNTCRTSFLSNTPVFVEYDICDTFEVYTFWLWYGQQKECIVFEGGHGNDWEHVSVFVTGGSVQKVIFYQHSGWYTRRRGTYESSGERPHVYIGKTAHGSYHAPCDGVCSFSEFVRNRCLGSVNYCQGGCGYWDDFRNPGPKLDSYTIRDLQPGNTIDGITRPDREVCRVSCDGSGSRVLTTAGCWQNKE